MKKNFTNFRSAFLLFCALVMVQAGIAQRTVIAGWTFTNTTSTYTETTYPSNCEDGLLYLDGSFGSDVWTVTTGTSVSNGASYYYQGLAPDGAVCGETTATKALGIAGNDKNGSSIVFAFSATGLQDIQLSYTFSRTQYGFNTAEWSHSTDGVTYTSDTLITNDVTTKTFYTLDFSNATDINGQSTVYIRVTVDGASRANGNNKFDNILITGASDVPAAMQPTFSVEAGNFCVPFEEEEKRRLINLIKQK